MIVYIHPKVEKDVKKISDKLILESFCKLIQNLEQLDSLSNLKGVKKLVGFSHYYRVRIGDYRVGFRCIGGEIFIERFLHRKDIYRFYP